MARFGDRTGDFGQCRRYSRDYEELPETSEAMISISMVRLQTR